MSSHSGVVGTFDLLEAAEVDGTEKVGTKTSQHHSLWIFWLYQSKVSLEMLNTLRVPNLASCGDLHQESAYCKPYEKLL